MSRVLIIGDLHAPGILPKYPRFLKKINDEWGCNKVVLIGDVLDFGAISFHEKHPDSPSFKDEMRKAQKQVDKIYELFPKAEWLTGNHDCLPSRQAGRVGIPEHFLVPSNVLFNTPGWVVHPRYTRLVIDGVTYCHGDSGKGGQYAAVKNSRDNFSSWVSGHCHSQAGVWYTQVEGRDSPIFGMNVGCGLDRDLLMFHYGVKFNYKPVVSCGVVIDGKRAYLETM